MFNSRFVLLRTAALCACLLSVLLCGCGGGSSSPSAGNGPVTSAPRSANGLQFTLSANKSSYAVGETVQLTLTVKNIGAQPTIIANSNYTSADVIFQVMQNNQVVYSSPTGGTAGVSTNVSPNYVISVGQTQALSETWFQNNAFTSNAITSQQVAPGTYMVHAYLTTASINGVAFTSEQAQATLSANPIQIAIHN